MSDSQLRKIANNEQMRTKPNKMFAMIKSELEDKTKKRNKSSARVRSIVKSFH